MKSSQYLLVKSNSCRHRWTDNDFWDRKLYFL